MLNYQSTSFHDALYLRKVLGLQAAPEFEAWLTKQGIIDAKGQLTSTNQVDLYNHFGSLWIK